MLLFGPGSVVVGHAVALENLAQGGREALGVLAHVERGQMEAEDLGLTHQGGETAIGQTCGAVGAQAVLHQAQVGDELPGGAVDVGRGT